MGSSFLHNYQKTSDNYGLTYKNIKVFQQLC